MTKQPQILDAAVTILNVILTTSKFVLPQYCWVEYSASAHCAARQKPRTLWLQPNDNQ